MNKNTMTSSIRVAATRFVARAIAVVMLLMGTWAQAAETITYYHLNALGSPVAATDQSGNVLWREDYRPYGDRIKRQAAAQENDLWYTGKPHKDSLGLSYLGARWYDPVVGRFYGVDPVDWQEDSPVHSFNRYAYANNNPYRFVDPDGRKVANNSPDPAMQEALDDTKNNPATSEIFQQAEEHERTVTFQDFDKAPPSIRGHNPPAVTVPADEQAKKDRKPTDSTVFIDVRDKFEVKTTKGRRETPIEVVIAHELKHALDNANGTARAGTDSNFGVSIDERVTRTFENRIRDQLNLPLRVAPNGRVF